MPRDYISISSLGILEITPLYWQESINAFWIILENFSIYGKILIKGDIYIWMIQMLLFILQGLQ